MRRVHSLVFGSILIAGLSACMPPGQIAITNAATKEAPQVSQTVGEKDTVVIFGAKMLTGPLLEGDRFLALDIAKINLETGTYSSNDMEKITPCIRYEVIPRGVRAAFNCGEGEPSYIAKKLEPGRYAILNVDFRYFEYHPLRGTIKQNVSTFSSSGNRISKTTPVFEVFAGEKLYVGTIGMTRNGNFIVITNIDSGSNGLEKMTAAINVPPGALTSAIMIPYASAQKSGRLRDPSLKSWSIMRSAPTIIESKS